MYCKKSTVGCDFHHIISPCAVKHAMRRHLIWVTHLFRLVLASVSSAELFVFRDVTCFNISSTAVGEWSAVLNLPTFVKRQGSDFVRIVLHADDRSDDDYIGWFYFRTPWNDKKSAVKSGFYAWGLCFPCVPCERRRTVVGPKNAKEEVNANESVCFFRQTRRLLFFTFRAESFPLVLLTC